MGFERARDVPREQPRATQKLRHPMQRSTGSVSGRFVCGNWHGNLRHVSH
jgi:hypothetical protein